MIFVTGCARSGTSLVTGILSALGVETGKVNALNENLQVREHILKPCLESLGADRLGQWPLPDPGSLPPRHGLREDVIRALGFPSEPWCYKDAKLTLVWPLWRDAFPEAKWLLVRRPAKKIAESCLRTPFMRACEDEAGWLGWVREHEVRFEAMKAGLDLLEVWPDRFIGDTADFALACAFLGLEFDRSRVEDCIDPARWH